MNSGEGEAPGKYMGYVKVISGDATRPVGEGNKVICHICNDSGIWGAGFVVALSKRWLKPERDYLEWRRGDSEIPFLLGEVQFVRVEDDVWVANMVAQSGTRPKKGIAPIRYEALERCLEKVAKFAVEKAARLHMPRIGAGLAGGSWGRIKSIIGAVARKEGVKVTIYEFADRKRH
jgi:O-acetyl-ADP-ribose deacetylase (regulator of RNase III)